MRKKERMSEKLNHFNREELSLIRMNLLMNGEKRGQAFYAIYFVRNLKLVKISLDEAAFRKSFRRTSSNNAKIRECSNRN